MSTYVLYVILFFGVCSTMISCMDSGNGIKHSAIVTTDSFTGDIFDSMVAEVCDCSRGNLGTARTKLVLDSCYRKSLSRHYESLQFDTASTEGLLAYRNTMSNRFWANNFRLKCPEIYELVFSPSKQDTKFFSGFISKRQVLNDGFVFQVINRDSKMTFFTSSDIYLLPESENVVVQYNIKVRKNGYPIAEQILEVSKTTQ